MEEAVYLCNFPFRRKNKKTCQPEFRCVQTCQTGEGFDLMRTTPVLKIRMPSWPPKRRTADAICPRPTMVMFLMDAGFWQCF